MRMHGQILKYIADVEEEQMGEYNIREFTKLIEKHKQVWKPTKEELETINMDNEESQRDPKIRTLKEPEDLIILLRDYVNSFT